MNKRTKKRNKKRTKKRNIKNKRQNGGFYKELDLEYIRNWENIHRKMKDCCPCVFNFLGLDLEESNYLIEIYGDTGMYADEIIETISDKFPNYSFSFIKSSESLTLTMNNIEKLMSDKTIDTSEKMDLYIHYFEMYQKEIEKYLNDIPNKHGVVGIIKSNEFIHCVVFARVSNQLVIFDSQVKKSITGSENITSHFISRGIYGLEYLMGIGKSSKDNPSSPWEDLKVSDELPSMNSKSNKLPKNKPSKYYPSLFSDYPIDTVVYGNIEKDIFYDTVEGPEDIFYDASSGL